MVFRLQTPPSVPVKLSLSFSSQFSSTQLGQGTRTINGTRKETFKETNSSYSKRPAVHGHRGKSSV